MKNLNNEKLTNQEKKNLKNNIPKPKLNNMVYETKNNKIYKFNPELYKNNLWLSGCEEYNLLFCFPCIITKKNSDTWNKNGFNNLENIKK